MSASRRHVLKALGASALSGLCSSLLAHPLTAATPADFAAGAPELWPFQGLAGEDMSSADLRVEGRWPKGLSGCYFKNGPGLLGREGTRLQHWFDGDGFVQRWAIADGRVSHRGRFVKTRKFQLEQAQGRYLFPAPGTPIEASRPAREADTINTANTSVLALDGALYALWEGGSAYELDPASLDTRGLKHWAPELSGLPFSAHPKVDRDGSVWNFGLSGSKLVLWHLSARGQVLLNQIVDLPGPCAMLHDFALSSSKLVFLLSPITLDTEALEQGTPLFRAMHFQARDATRVLILDKADPSRRTVLEMPAAMVFHVGNAWDDGETLQMDYVEARPLEQVQEDFRLLLQGRRPSGFNESRPRQLRIDLRRGSLSVQARQEAVEFPVVDPRFVGQRYRHVFYPEGRGRAGRWGFNGLLHLDLASGRERRFSFGPDVVLEEHVLVPRSAQAAEGDGWLLGLGFDSGRRRSFMSVFDTRHLSQGPVARAWLPGWVPYGFHGRFVSA